jgi:hypothetical protein
MWHGSDFTPLDQLPLALELGERISGHSQRYKLGNDVRNRDASLSSAAAQFGCRRGINLN